MSGENSPRITDEEFKNSSQIVCEYCLQNENYWMTECSDFDADVQNCPVARLLGDLEE